MSAESVSNLKFEIGHVLFVDIVGYSKLLITEQSELLRELNEIVCATKQFRDAEADGKLIRLPTGDGMAQVFRNHPEAPAQCALEISQALKLHPNIQLRMGIHSGPVNQVTDVNEHTLRLDPTWDPLRDVPCFQALLKEYPVEDPKK